MSFIIIFVRDVIMYKHEIELWPSILNVYYLFVCPVAWLIVQTQLFSKFYMPCFLGNRLTHHNEVEAMDLSSISFGLVRGLSNSNSRWTWNQMNFQFNNGHGFLRSFLLLTDDSLGRWKKQNLFNVKSSRKGTINKQKVSSHNNWFLISSGPSRSFWVRDIFWVLHSLNLENMIVTRS